MRIDRGMLLAAMGGMVGGCGAADQPLELGAAVPQVEAKTHEGKLVKLHQLGAEGWLLVYFYPKASTPGCTKQACSLRDADEELRELGVRVLGVSRDTVEDQKAFATAQKLPFPLIADVDGKVVEAFGVPRKPVVGVPARQAYLFQDGKLVWRDLHASTSRQAEDVLKAIRQTGTRARPEP